MTVSHPLEQMTQNIMVLVGIYKNARLFNSEIHRSLEVPHKAMNIHMLTA